MAREPFVWGGSGQKMSPTQVAERRKIAQALLQQAGDTSPVGHWSAAVNRGLQGLIGSWDRSSAENAEEAGRTAAMDRFNNRSTANPVAAALAGVGDGGAPVAGGHSPNDGHDHSNMTTADWLVYSNQGATRSLPIADPLVEAMSFLPDLGLTMEVYSGGQDAEGPNRVGSTRHDHGNAADVMFRDASGRMLDWNNPNDIPVLQQIVSTARSRGVTGFGAGDDYMGAGRMHIGFGNPGVWGAGGSGANAPDWLRQAFNGAQPASSGAGSYAAPASGNVSEIASLLADEWLPESARSVLTAEMNQQMQMQNAAYQAQLQSQDPLRQLQIQQAQLELEQARQPQQPKPIEVGGVLLDPNTYQPLFDSRQGNKPTGNIQEYEYYVQGAQGRGEQPMPFEQYLAAIARAGSGAASGVGTIPAGYQAVTDPLTGQITSLQPIPGGPAELQAEKEADALASRETNKANAAAVVLQDIDKAIGQTSGWTAGAGGAVLGNLPGTGATDLRATIDTVRANIGFDRLQQMRDASPTGGALGGIAIQELQMLQAVLGSLDQAQSPAQLKANLERLREIYEPIAAKAAAYPNAAQFGFDGGTPAPEVAPQGQPAQPKSKAEFDALPSGATFVAPDGTIRRKP